MSRALVSALLLPLVLAGCGTAGAIVSVATAPVRVATRAVDVATVSQSEKDQRRGREIRQREERLGELERDYRHQSEKCTAGNAAACTRRDADLAEMQGLMPGVADESR